jgi:hypothetical protein
MVLIIAVFLTSYNQKKTYAQVFKKFLVRTKLFRESESKESPVKNQGIKVALIALIFGLLFTLQIDWLLSQVIVHFTEPVAASVSPKLSVPSFNSPQFEQQLSLYKQRLVTGKPRVLIVGSSRALRGIDPVALSQGLATQGYRNNDVFNFSVNGATAQVVDFLIRQVLQPKELPQLIIWGDGARAFNSGREDLTFNAIAGSEGYKMLQRSKGRNSYQILDDWLNQQLSRVSFSYEKRDEIKKLFKRQEPQQVVDSNGFLPLSIRFHPQTYYQKHPRVPGNQDRDYKSFNLGSRQNTALQSVIKFTKAKKIPIVFVNLPLTAEYLDPVRTKYEKQFQQYMSRSISSNFIYRDLSKLFPQANNYFSDPSHLNRYGAYQVSKKLAADSIIPWSPKKRK